MKHEQLKDGVVLLQAIDQLRSIQLPAGAKDVRLSISFVVEKVRKQKRIDMEPRVGERVTEVAATTEVPAVRSVEPMVYEVPKEVEFDVPYDEHFQHVVVIPAAVLQQLITSAEAIAVKSATSLGVTVTAKA